MQKLFNYLLLIILITGIFSCSNTAAAQEDSSWTSMNPLSIPLKIRQAYYNKGNLVPNPSFEQVKILKNDSLVYNFDLTDWNVIGKNVQLTDISKSGFYDSTDAFHGIHAIKIVRTFHDVKEMNNQPQGVLSGFIEVIPANYDFYFDIRLEKIMSIGANDDDNLKDRFERRIGKNIDIHLKFYDKNKKELDPGIYFEYVKDKIDNSFKGFAFSNFYSIDKFDWARVHGRTWNYPFSEGDLPAGCRYIKIFLGLNCSGTMWVDNIDFHLSRWNFTPTERLDSMFRKKYDLTDLMIPTPQIIENKQYFELKNRHIELFSEVTESPETKAALTLLQKRFGRVHGASIKIYKSAASLRAPKDLQIILINNNLPAASQFEDAFRTIKNKDQGYFIRKDGNKIYLGANQSKGLFYAASSLCQLVDYTNSILDYADITDYPDFLGRSTKMISTEDKWTHDKLLSLSDSAITGRMMQRQKYLEKQTQDVDFYTFYKINKIYDSYGGSKSWWLPGDFYKTLYQKVGARCAQFGDIIHTAVQLNPYYHFNITQEYKLSDSLRDLFSHGTDEGFEKIKNALKPALDAGAKTVMLCADDYVPRSGTTDGEYTLFTNSDKAKFTDLADAQDFMINRLKSWLNKQYGNIRLEFVPPPYSNWHIDFGRGSAETYFSDLVGHLDSSVILVWTGPTVRSLSYDIADIRRCTEVYRKKPMIWDNTFYVRNAAIDWQGGYPAYYPQKSVMCDLFEPFDIQYPKNFATYLNSDYYSNLNGFGEINKIKYMSFADFAWNTNDYNPDFSLFKSLVQYVGKENARLLLKFNNAYYQFVSSWGQLRMDIEHNPEYKCSEEQINQAEQQIKALTTAFGTLTPIDNKDLKEEIKNIMNTQIDAWRKLSKGPSAQIDIKDEIRW